jgi:ferric-dicitrate binding protein FerR (iron transport regulator)
MEIDKTIKDKILAYFNGQLSSSGEAELLDWIKEKSENRAYFFLMKERLDPDKMEHPLLQSSYAELKDRLAEIRRSNVIPTRTVKEIRLTLSRVAAIILLALITGFTVAYLVHDKMQESKQVAWFETYVPRGEKSQLLLPDGSKVWLNSESSLSYPGNFMEGNKNVRLTGEGYFEVAKQNGSTFTVATSDYDVIVHGTRFNVTAYHDFKRTETTLVEGSIEVRKNGRNIEVVPGQTLRYDGDQFFLDRTDAQKAALWKDNIFDFDQITFRELVLRLERWYDVDIEIKNPDLNKTIYSGVFKNEETIDQVLNTLELTSPIRYTRDGFRKFIIE